MPTNIGPKISIDGYSKYRQDMKNITADTKALKAEMQNLEKGYSETGKKSETYKQKVENLNSQIENQKKVVEENEKMLEAARAEFKEGSEQVGKYKEAVAKAKNELAEMEDKLKSIPTPLQEFGQQLETAGEDIAEKGTAISKFGSNLSAKVTVPLTLLGTAAVSAASGFEQVMANVQALSQADPEEMEKLTAMARELGKSTVWSADQVGEGFGYMALAGWSVDSMLSGIVPILNLATASGTDLATTSDLVTDALTAFGLSAEDAGHFADVLAQTSRSSNTSVLQMGEAFKFAAPLAGTLGYSVEDVALALGLMANSGIKAETAGTTLRAMFSKLAAPTGKAAALMESFGLSLVDENGNTKSLVTVIEELRTAFQGLSQDEAVAAATTLVGRNAMSGFLAIIGATDTDVTSLSTSIKTADGAASDMAKTMGNTTTSKLTKAKNAAHDAGIEIGNKLAPYIQKAAEKATDLASQFGNMDTKTQENVVKFGLLAAAAGPVASGIGNVVTAIGNTVTQAGKLVNFVTLHPLGAILTVAAAVASWVLLDNHIKNTKNTTSELTKTADDVKEALKGVNTQLSTAKTNLASNQAASEGMANRASELVKKLDALTKKEKLSNAEKEQMKIWVDELNRIYPDLNLEIDENGTSLNKSTEELKAYIAQMKEMARAEAYYEAMTEAYKAQAAAEAELAKAEKALKQAEDESAATERERKLLQDQILGITESREQAEKNLKARLDEGKISTDDYNAALKAMDSGQVSLNGSTLTLSEAQRQLIQKEKLNTNQLKGLREAVDQANISVKDAKTFADEMAGAYETAATNAQKVGNGAKEAGEKTGKEYTQGVVNGMSNPTKVSYLTSASHSLLAGMTPANAKEAAGVLGKDFVQGTVNGMNNPTKKGYLTSARKSLLVGMTPTGTKSAGETAGKDMVQGVANGESNSTKMGYVKSAASNLKSAGTPAGMYDSGYTVGNNMSSGFIQGIKDKLQNIKDAAASAAQSAIDKMKNLFDSHSPSRVMMDLGHDVGEGFIIGITGENSAIEHAMADTFDLGMLGATPYAHAGNISNSTAVNITVNGAPGQDVHELADIIEEKIAFNLRNREAAFA